MANGDGAENIVGFEVEQQILRALIAYLVLAKVYFFSVPFRGIALATALYVAGQIAHAA